MAIENFIPELRFPEFKKTKESAPLVKYKFDDIFLFSIGKNIKQNEASPSFKIPCVRYGELYHMYGEIISEVINKTNLKEEELIFSQGNEILIPSAGEDPLDIGKASALIVKNVAIGRTINILKPKFDSVYSAIYASYYINQKLKRKISSLAKGVSISNVYNSDLKNLEITIPPLQEQEKIASFLIKIEKCLELLTKKKYALIKYKKGVMQKIFSQEIRFKDENGNDFPDWEEKKLGEICLKAQSGGTPKSTIKEYYNGDIPFLSINDMTTQGKYLNYTSKNISQKGLENSSAWIVPKDSIIYSMYASVGFVSINKIALSTSQAVMNVILKKGYDLEFIYYSLLDFRRFISKYIETGTQGNINAQIVKAIPILIPALPEQKKIVSFLSSLDASLDQIDSKIESTKAFKQGLLQKMFV